MLQTISYPAVRTIAERVPTETSCVTERIPMPILQVMIPLEDGKVLSPPPFDPTCYGTLLSPPLKMPTDAKTGLVDINLLLQTRMELVWHGEFDRLFSQYLHHMWYLMPTFLPPGDRFQVFKDSAKVRFSCQCGHGWTSMKGRVVFWFYLNYCANSGYVLFKLYGQQCQRCKNDRFEHSMWYPEEVIKVIGNVYNRVGQIYYGFVRPPLRIDRRQGKPRNQHQSELCLACKEGLCKEEWIS